MKGPVEVPRDTMDLQLGIESLGRVVLLCVVLKRNPLGSYSSNLQKGAQDGETCVFADGIDIKAFYLFIQIFILYYNDQ